MVKRKQLPARAVADAMGFVPMRPAQGMPELKYGRKALIGQYVKPYTREDGTTGKLDYSAVINARR